MDASAVFRSDGPLAREISGFSPRDVQIRMANAVADAFEAESVLVVEAGTGTGKTFAYLVPALQSGQRVIVSTGTRHLQDQLFHRDLPLVRRALDVPVDIALLKGRANYLCLHRLAISAEDGRFRSRQDLADLETIRRWSQATEYGDIAELATVPEESMIWPLVTSTTDNCLGTDCDYIQCCHVVKARRRAQEAEVLVINHHLLFADMALKEEGFGELLPGADAFVIDEAHQLPDVASRFFGINLTSRQLLGVARDAALEHLREAGDMAELPKAANALEKAVSDLRLSFGRESRRTHWQQVARNSAVNDALENTEKGLEELTEWLKHAASRGRGLDNCWQRAQELQRIFTLVCDPPEDYIHWLETTRRGFGIHFTPFEVASQIRGSMNMLGNTWIFTSATLAVGEGFEHFVHRVGLEDPDTLRVDSPFDYENNALLYLPDPLPDPGSPEHTQAVVETARAVLEHSKGRAFLLFTSHRALQAAAKMLDDELPFPLLVQGSAPRSELLERFRRAGNAVLLGTGSFWEGVDVRGDALSCVIIDKLPFASPGDPVLNARIDSLRKHGGNPFMEYQVPQAVIALKQGVGRLIRDVSDRGLLVLCDPRLRTKSYGKIFLNSLPAMPRTSNLEDVRQFFEAEHSLIEPGLAAGANVPEFEYK